MKIGDKVSFLPGGGGYEAMPRYPKWPDSYYGKIVSLGKNDCCEVRIYKKETKRPSLVLGMRTDWTFKSDEVEVMK